MQDVVEILTGKRTVQSQLAAAGDGRCTAPHPLCFLSCRNPAGTAGDRCTCTNTPSVSNVDRGFLECVKTHHLIRLLVYQSATKADSKQFPQNCKVLALFCSFHVSVVVLPFDTLKVSFLICHFPPNLSSLCDYVTLQASIS